MPETLAKRLQRAANRLLDPLGLHVIRARHASGMDDILARAAARGLSPATIIDIGASDGVWSLGARRHFPAARFLLFEPLDEQRPALEKLGRKFGFEIVNAVAGATTGTAAMRVGDDLDGSSVVSSSDASSIGGRSRTVPVESVDGAAARLSLHGPFLLKLDTHGYEKEVFGGASDVLKQTCLIVVESYNFKLHDNCLRFHELCSWLEERGFRCCDLADPMRRPGDGVLWQMDLVFAPSGSPCFAKASFV